MPSNDPLELGKNRVEALADGLFAIAMTILVLGFKLPNLPETAPNVQVAPAIWALWPAFVTYAVAFIGIGIYWILHHYVFHVVRAIDGTLMWLNLLFFLFISVLPFTVQLVNQFHRAPITPVLMGTNLAIVGWLLYAQWVYILRDKDLLVDHFAHWYRDAVSLRITLAPVAATLTTLICFWSISTSLAVYLAILPIYFLPLRRRRFTDEAGEPRKSRWAITPRQILIVGGAAVSLVAWAAFRPELLFVNHKVDETFSSMGSAPVLTGTFVGLAHETSGEAAVYDTGSQRVLRFTGFSTANGPDVHVYLVAAPDASSDDVVRHAGFINLGKMKGNEGDQNYVLPPDVNLSTYRSISLWCERFNVNFGACSLK